MNRADHFRIVSGGQTGVDRAALDAAIELGIPYGGWCPKRRLAEDGKIPEIYNLKETPSKTYKERTILNVRDSDATLIITWGRPKGGTGYTLKKAYEQNRPSFIFDMETDTDIGSIVKWVRDNDIKVLNVAGPRESFMPGIVYKLSKEVLRRLFSTFSIEMF
jgi:hypothetical protein